MHAFVFPLVVLWAIAPGEIRTLAKHIEQSQIRRLLVIPEALVRNKDGRVAFSDDAPLARAVADRVRQQLGETLGKTCSLLDPQGIEQDIAGWTEEDLRSDHKYAALASSRQAALVAVLAEPGDRGAVELHLRLYTARGKEAEVTLDVCPTLSDFAYAGRSFEVRRWNGPTLEIPRFTDPEDRELMLGQGPHYEEMQLCKLLRAWPEGDRRHPLGEGNPAFTATFLVDGRPRPLEIHGGDFYLPVEIGERLAIRLRQNMAESILLAIYIDGHNTFGQVAEHPQVTPVGRMWNLRRDGGWDLRGWHLLEGPTGAKERPFVIQQRGVEGAKPDRIGDRAGMITMIAYTNGVEGIPGVPTGDLQTSGATGLCIGGDAARDVTLKRSAGSKGLMLFAATVRYRSRAELARIPETEEPRKTPICTLPGPYQNLHQENEASPQGE
jgi:hypothetical protein